MSTMDVVKQNGRGVTRPRVQFAAGIESLEGRLLLSATRHRAPCTPLQLPRLSIRPRRSMPFLIPLHVTGRSTWPGTGRADQNCDRRRDRQCDTHYHRRAYIQYSALHERSAHCQRRNREHSEFIKHRRQHGSNSDHDSSLGFRISDQRQHDQRIRDQLVVDPHRPLHLPRSPPAAPRRCRPTTHPRPTRPRPRHPVRRERRPLRRLRQAGRTRRRAR